MSREKLSQEAIEEALEELHDWVLMDEKLHRVFKFKDFVEAMGFMTRAGIVAEVMNHHPEWFNVYNKVIVDLTTHDAGGITQLDLDLARRMSELAA